MKKNPSIYYSLVEFSLVLIFCAVFAVACNMRTDAKQPDPAQVAKISAVAHTLAQSAAAIQLQQHPESRAELLAVAEAIEQAAAQPSAPPPNNLVNLASAAATQFAGPYGALAGAGLQAGFALYQQFYAANANAALDKQPAFKAVLLAMVSGIRAAAQPSNAPASPAAIPTLTAEDLVLRPAK